MSASRNLKSSAAAAADYSNELGAQVFSNFVFTHDLYTSDLPLSPKAHFNIKLAAFQIVKDTYRQSYDAELDDLLALREHVDDNDGIVLPRDQCVHRLIGDIKNVIDTLHHINSQPKYQYNMFIFLPYVKQLRMINSRFESDYCCAKIVKANALALSTLVAHADKYLSAIRAMNERMHLINVFVEPKLYQCNICQESSVEEHFLKPDECCGYSICCMCYANLWKFSNMYPVCPVCKTSFKSSSKKIVEP
ncbi:EXON0 [Alphabaculovirus myunipunctae]|uniref:EXON0 n=1 Tax=Mythimna unipuncta nucleopolyhedrovirus TaxID=447897 RepID=A0A2K9VSJ6_9ABAC|nr:EXON0 [Mythimna unipuncta nucleopolyhedrovirus]AUV65414.1 EXON0 [Mythimna unipuncta nucleopolyhedrovirus]